MPQSTPAFDSVRTVLIPKAHAYERWIAGGVVAVVASLVLCAWLPMPVRALAMGVIGAAVLGFSGVVSWWRPRTPVKIPIVLMLHTVNEQVVDPICPNNTVRPAELAHLLADLRAAGYTFQTLSEAFEKPVRRSVVLTFDDGYVDNYTELFPILKAFKAKATCFVTNRGERNPAFLTPAQIREMAASGLVEFGGHTAHHTRLDEVPLEVVERELAENRAWLTNLLGVSPRAFAYPCGGYNDQVVEAVGRAGYTLAATMCKQLRPLAKAPLLINRRTVPRGLRPWQAYLLVTRGRFFP